MIYFLVRAPLTSKAFKIIRILIIHICDGSYGKLEVTCTKYYIIFLLGIIGYKNMIIVIGYSLSQPRKPKT